MGGSDLQGITLNGVPLEEAFEKQRKETLEKDTRVDYVQHIARTTTDVAEQRKARSSRYPRKNKWDLYDFQSKNSRTRRLTPAQILLERGEESTMFKEIQQAISEEAKPVSLSDLIEKLRKLGKKMNKSNLRPVLLKLRNEDHVILFRKEGGNYVEIRDDAIPDTNLHVRWKAAPSKSVEEVSLPEDFIDLVKLATRERPMCDADVRNRADAAGIFAGMGLPSIRRRFRKLREKGLVNCYSLESDGTLKPYPLHATTKVLYVVWAANDDGKTLPVIEKPKYRPKPKESKFFANRPAEERRSTILRLLRESRGPMSTANFAPPIEAEGLIPASDWSMRQALCALADDGLVDVLTPPTAGCPQWTAHPRDKSRRSMFFHLKGRPLPGEEGPAKTEEPPPQQGIPKTDEDIRQVVAETEAKIAAGERAAEAPRIDDPESIRRWMVAGGVKKFKLEIEL